MIAKRFLGESTVAIGRAVYTVRPSFAALYAIEQKTGVTIPQVIGYVDGVGCKAEIVRYVIESGLEAFYGTPPALPRLNRRQWLALRYEAITFLIQGLGYLVEQTANPAAETEMSPKVIGQGMPRADETLVPPPQMHVPPLEKTARFEPLDWPQLYKVATGMLGRGEAEFWQMTLCGLMLQCEARAVFLGVGAPEIGHPATRDDLREMMQLYPDASLVSAG